MHPNHVSKVRQADLGRLRLACRAGSGWRAEREALPVPEAGEEVNVLGWMKGARSNPSPPGDRFDALQAKWREKSEALTSFRIGLERKYGGRYSSSWLSSAENRKLEQLRAAGQKAADAFYAWLDANSPWEWRSGVASHWVRDRLTREMALSETPPFIPEAGAGYGYGPGPRPRKL